ncbi:MAG: CDP-alcohol phosphatidyltransferase family protein [Candidatus Marinimicrobia bacterium]|jgi:CDP-diacylglycerol--glycerol-3-phosphate 3-phosphatidyltransferase|nr:CDP-alcohol phosphatidyltransferase family protein [Candidatus Neomarinimicrobiota bacterium]MDP6578183.1 CDP-alcohol phosphatidyltransferase family protein [Candidatus Neomarinimicrobiota bacterium]MDP7061015.1 CDP-alcohol phosphatidyltransferase family protein [Candidatus Neomarinimicrobiota bacterium]|tara:strand:- start:1331 stop:1897 length:567 start_codon:yes stop_codon:yes gene_type:complete
MPDDQLKTRITHPSRVITLANLLSILRAFLALPIVYSLARDRIVLAVLLVLFAVVTDWLDGYFARRAHEVTDFGKFLDPVADSIAIAAVVLFLSLDETRNFPFWFFIFYMIRQLTIALSGVYMLNHSHLVYGSNIIGKWTVGITALAILLYIVRMENFGFYLILVSTILASVSWIQYLLRNLNPKIQS